VTDVFPAFALAVEPSSGETMKRRPRPPGQTILSRPFLTLIGWQGVMLAAISILTYLWALNAYGEGPHARTMALLSIVGVQLGHMFNCRSRTRSAFRGFFTNPYIFVAAGLMIGLQTLALCVTPIARALELKLPNPLDIGVVVGCCFLPILVVEFTKAINHK
jgi:Ca2+-transporting ATPase